QVADIRHIMALCRGSIADLTVRVLAPTLHLPAIENNAIEVSATRQPNCGRETGGLRPYGAVRRRALAAFTVSLVTPAAHRAILQERAHVIFPLARCEVGNVRE